MVVLNKATIDYFEEIRKKNKELYNRKLSMVGLKDSDIPWRKIPSIRDSYFEITFDEGFNSLENPDKFLYGYYDPYYDEDYEDDVDEETRPHKKKNTIILIDAEGIGADKYPNIIGQAKIVGEIFEVRYFARQNDNSTKAWMDVARNNDNVKAILSFGEPEPNKIDKLLIKHAKRVLRDIKSIDVFCIAARDGDFKELVDLLRSNNKKVVILAPKNTSQRLKSAASDVRGI